LVQDRLQRSFLKLLVKWDRENRVSFLKDYVAAYLLTEKPFLTRVLMSRSPGITRSLTDICQLHFQDLGIGAIGQVIAKNL
jgi:hypothetical protein